MRGRVSMHRDPQHRPEEHPPRPPVRHHQLPPRRGPVHLQVQPPQGCQGCQPRPPSHHHPWCVLHLQHGMKLI